jgi:hypothetical protein
MAVSGDIQTWLAERGFAQYVEAFASNVVTLDVL